MGKIVAIGGGEIYSPDHPSETTAIDEEIVRLSGKKNPRVLFVPTASGDAESYSTNFSRYYRLQLDCGGVSILRLYDKLSLEEIRGQINTADIIYVGGGNTLRMMMLWRKLGVDKLLIEAYRQNKVLAGLSAGAICWLKSGLSDSRSFSSKGKSWDYIVVRGLDLQNIILCPHYDFEPKRRPALENYLKDTRKTAVALDNCAALEIVDDKYRIVTAKESAGAYKAYWGQGTYNLEALEVGKFSDLSHLS